MLGSFSRSDSYHACLGRDGGHLAVVDKANQQVIVLDVDRPANRARFGDQLTRRSRSGTSARSIGNLWRWAWSGASIFPAESMSPLASSLSGNRPVARHCGDPFSDERHPLFVDQALA